MTVMTVREMRELLGLSRAAFSRIYKIPVRTLEDWEAGRRKCPDYVLHLLERCVKDDKEKDGSLLRISVDRQIEEMNQARDEEDIINNRFL